MDKQSALQANTLICKLLILRYLNINATIHPPPRKRHNDTPATRKSRHLSQDDSPELKTICADRHNLRLHPVLAICAKFLCDQPSNERESTQF